MDGRGGRRPEAETIAEASRLGVELGDDGRVVGRALAPSGLLVDAAGSAGLCERSRAEDEIDAQAVIAAKAEHSVVPPAEEPLLLLEEPEEVAETHVEELAEGGPLGIAAEDLAAPLLGIVDVPVLRGDVEVAEHDEAGVAGKLGRQEVPGVLCCITHVAYQPLAGYESQVRILEDSIVISDIHGVHVFAARGKGFTAEDAEVAEKREVKGKETGRTKGERGRKHGKAGSARESLLSSSFWPVSPLRSLRSLR